MSCIAHNLLSQMFVLFFFFVIVYTVVCCYYNYPQKCKIVLLYFIQTAFDFLLFISLIENDYVFYVFHKASGRFFSL